MGILIFYEGDGRIAGDVPADEWTQIRRMMPLLVDLLNTEMAKKRSDPPPAKLVPAPFKVESLMRDESKTREEVNLRDPAEWRRFLAWWDYLEPRLPASRFYKPAVQVLKSQTRHPDQPSG